MKRKENTKTKKKHGTKKKQLDQRGGREKKNKRIQTREYNQRSLREPNKKKTKNKQIFCKKDPLGNNYITIIWYTYVRKFFRYY